MSKDLEVGQLRIFLTLAETLHFGRAAKRLGLAQPNLSQQIARLEAKVGYPLFFRGARDVQLSSAGRFLKQRATLLIESLESTMATARSLGDGEAGSLTVGFCGSVMLTHVAGMIGGFRSTYPDVTLELRELHVNEQLENLKQGMLDLCFVRDAGSPAGLDTLKIMAESYVAVLPNKHPFAKRKVLAPELLKEESFILFSPDMAKVAYDRTIALCVEHGFNPDVQCEAAQWTSLASLIGAGLGVSIAPACVANVLVPRSLLCPTCVEAAHVGGDCFPQRLK